MSDPDEKVAVELGRIAYQAYVEDSGGRSTIHGVLLPADFDDLPLRTRRAWCAAGIQVAIHQSRVVREKVSADLLANRDSDSASEAAGI
jgi:hypothetical protein